MSYRELRNFAEMMRALGYQRLVSVENFRSPNFPLVASTLYWMVQRYDPDIVMSDNIETEEARVHFLTKTAEALLNKANIKLNTKNLYMADGHAVRELLKVAKTLYAANQAQEAYKDGEELPDVPSLGTKSKDIRVARQLAAEITDRGARLHDLLGHENDVKQDRQAALRFLDTISSNLDGGEHAHVRSCVEIKILRRVRAESSRRPLVDFHTGEKKRRGLGRTVQGGHRECKEGLRRVRRRRTRLGRENQEEEERARAPREETLIITERAAGVHGRVREARGRDEEVLRGVHGELIREIVVKL